MKYWLNIITLFFISCTSSLVYGQVDSKYKLNLKTLSNWLSTQEIYFSDSSASYSNVVQVSDSINFTQKSKLKYLLKIDTTKSATEHLNFFFNILPLPWMYDDTLKHIPIDDREAIKHSLDIILNSKINDTNTLFKILVKTAFIYEVPLKNIKLNFVDIYICHITFL